MKKNPPAAGLLQCRDCLTISERQQWDFVLKISAVGEKIRLGSAANEILRYKMSAAGENFTV